MDLQAERRTHPTAQNLVDTVKEMLVHTPYNSLKSENVLFRSGVSRGPLYHHFENFEDLIEVAQTQIYQDYVGAVVAALTRIATTLGDPLATRQEFVKILEESEKVTTLERRRQRVGLIHNAASIDSFQEILSATQESLNRKWMQIYEVCVAKGWASPEFDSRTVAILMQSAFFGRILDDISPVHIRPEAWITTLSRLFDCFFFCKVLAAEM